MVGDAALTQTLAHSTGVLVRRGSWDEPTVYGTLELVLYCLGLWWGYLCSAEKWRRLWEKEKQQNTPHCTVFSENSALRNLVEGQSGMRHYMGLTALDDKRHREFCEARVSSTSYKTQLARIQKNSGQSRCCRNRECRPIPFGQGCCNQVNSLEDLHFVNTPTYTHWKQTS